MKRMDGVGAWLMAAVVAWSAWGTPSRGVVAPSRPNILIILTDDLGYSDIGCYGGEIETPVIDRLAANGLRFTQFYNTAKCHSTRVSLLSGRWCRQAGDESLRRAVTIPETLAAAGYFSITSGKWHLEKNPLDFGFDRFFGHLSGACDFYQGDSSFRLNRDPWPVPESGFYTTVAKVDFALRFLDEARETKRPWFLYLAFNAPHAPLQPMEADYRKYLGRYDSGWDRARAARAAKQSAMNLFGRDVGLPPRPENVPAWEDMTPDMRDWEARRMAALAGMIDRVDQEVGRLIADLERNGEMENTLIVFLSDNGACPYDRQSIGIDREPYERGVRWSDSTGWAWARNAPFRYYKQNQFEGGVATPAVVHWPAGLKVAPGSVIHSPAHVVDLLPTLAELAGVEPPAEWHGREPTPLAGISLASILAGGELRERPLIHFLFSEDRGLRDGDWKLVSFRSQPWELYNLAEDRTELHDRAGEEPGRVERMAKQWHDMAENVLMAPAKECRPVAESAVGHRHSEWTVFDHPGASSERHQSARVGRGKAAVPARAKAVRNDLPRARVGTKLSVENQQMVLHCEGDDPGLAFDSLGELPVDGPYALEFRIRSGAEGEGEVYWTTDPKTRLPGGSRIEFPVIHDNEWHAVTIRIPESKRMHAFRLDPCSGPGEVRIEGLVLKNASGAVLKSWP